MATHNDGQKAAESCPCCDGSGVCGDDHHTYTKKDMLNDSDNGITTKVAKSFMKRDGGDDE